MCEGKRFLLNPLKKLKNYNQMRFYIGKLISLLLKDEGKYYLLEIYYSRRIIQVLRFDITLKIHDAGRRGK